MKGVISCNEPHETKVTLSVEEWKERGVTNLKFNVADHIGAPTHAEVCIFSLKMDFLNRCS